VRGAARAGPGRGRGGAGAGPERKRGRGGAAAWRAAGPRGAAAAACPARPLNRPPPPTPTTRQVYLLTQLGKTLKTFLREAFDAGYGEGCEPNCIYDNYANVGYLSPDIPRALWLWFVRPMEAAGDGNFLHPLPLQVAISQIGEGRVLGGGASKRGHPEPRLRTCGQQLRAARRRLPRPPTPPRLLSDSRCPAAPPLPHP
jgi:hypothetical protein